MKNTRLDPWAPLLRHVVQPLYYAKNRDRRFQRLAALERNQWLPAGEVQALQVERLNALLRHAYETTEFYRQRLDECGLGPGPIRSIDDLSALPPVSKADLQVSLEGMISRAYDRKDLVADASGGSTGKPTVFYKDVDRHNLRRADQYRHDRWTGWNIGDPWALVWGARQDLVDERSLRERALQRYMERCIALDAFELSEARILSFLDRLGRFRPRMILGYAGALDHVARFILEKGRAGAVRPLAIVSSAERLTGEMRERIQAAFSCPVLDRYGSREAGLIASECRLRSGLHVNADNLLVEILENGRAVAPGEQGNVVVTDFWNFGMPLIRYDLGDRATASAGVCGCGRGLPLIQSIEGRASDFLVAADGTRIHGEYFTHLFYGNTGIAQFQFVQESMSEVVIRVVPAGESVPDIAQVVEKTRRVLGESVEVKVQLCTEIRPAASGKFRFTICNVHVVTEPREGR